MTLAHQVRQLQTLLLSFHPIIVIETVEEERVQTLLNAVVEDMKMALFEWSVTQGLARSRVDNRWTDECAPASAQKPAALDRTNDPFEALKAIQEVVPRSVFLLKDFATHLSDPVLARQLREVAQTFSQTRSALVLSGDSINLPSEIAHDAVYFDLGLPGRDELQQAVGDVIRSLRAKNRVDVSIQNQDVHQLVTALRGMTLKQARQVIAYAALEDGKLAINDVHRILERKAQIIREESLLEYIPINGNSKQSDSTTAPVELGGFAGLKQWLTRARVGFSPQAQAFNLHPPKGILIVGIQGCGKSLAAKAIAHAWTMPLLKLDAGRLYDKYVGESEKNFRKVIKLAESMAPCVLWIDEIEKSLGHSGSDSDGGLSQRLFGCFLTWMQEKSEDVFVVATANNISQIPPELLRKGRFDEIFFVDLPDDQERSVILRIHLTQRKQNPQQFDLPNLVAATSGYSGAEIEQAVVTALYNALFLQKALDTELLLQAIRSTVPLSVSRREDLERLRMIAQKRFVNAR